MSSLAAELESLRGLLLTMSHERTLESLLEAIASRLTALPSVVLARIWLRGPGDECATCAFSSVCEDRSWCLHLAASGGNPRVGQEGDWARLDGRFRRVPLNARMVCVLASRGQAVEVLDITEENASWIADPEWARREGVRGFLGLPLLFKGETLGSMAVFFRSPISREDELVWLHMVADHAAAGIANARAFEEIARLKARLELENAYLREEASEAHGFGELVGISPALRNVARQIELVAHTDASVLILGESGTGKELVAHEIHRRSLRRDMPMIRVNCAAIPRDLYESEFFGHASGAFTGALRDRAGRFEAADGGTLFLDEVGEIPLDLQSKLLRVLQEGQYERVGEETTRGADVRIIAATNHDLRVDIEQGKFRRDLYFRLNVFPIEIAPLRKRLEDIPLLASNFVDAACRKLNYPRPRLTKAHVLELQGYHWPGNVRELQNIIERAVITGHPDSLHFDLPQSHVDVPVSAMPGAGQDSIETEGEMKRREKDNVLRALRQAGGRVYGKGGAAELLGVKPTTLISRLSKWGVTAASYSKAGV